MPVIHKQSVAEHSFGVVNIARWLMAYHIQGSERGFRLDVIETALDHDEDEAANGDMPSTSKPFKMPKAQRDIIVKLADKLEALVYIAEERKFGSNWFNEIVDPIHEKVHAYWEEFEWDHAQGRKWITSDLIREVVRLSVEGHPALETRIDQVP